MVASHNPPTELAREVQGADGVRPASDEVAHEDEPVLSVVETHLLEQLLELARAPVHVADDDRPTHRWEHAR